MLQQRASTGEAGTKRKSFVSFRVMKQRAICIVRSMSKTQLEETYIKKKLKKVELQDSIIVLKIQTSTYIRFYVYMRILQKTSDNVH